MYLQYIISLCRKTNKLKKITWVSCLLLFLFNKINLIISVATEGKYMLSTYHYDLRQGFHDLLVILHPFSCLLVKLCLIAADGCLNRAKNSFILVVHIR